jgi:hypothetical protein
MSIQLFFTFLNSFVTIGTSALCLWFILNQRKQRAAFEQKWTDIEKILDSNPCYMTAKIKYAFAANGDPFSKLADALKDMKGAGVSM